MQIGVGLMGRVGKSVLQRLPKEHGFSLGINQGRPYSRGEVRLRSNVATEHPDDRTAIFQRQAGSRHSRARRRTDDVARRPPEPRADHYRTHPAAAGPQRTAIAESIRERASTAFHPVGTCRMGSDETRRGRSVTQGQGVRGLRVADASIIPLLMNANTNAAAIMVGEKAAATILAG